MMRPGNEVVAVYVCLKAVDFRKGINGLSALVEGEMALDVFSEGRTGSDQHKLMISRENWVWKYPFWRLSGLFLPKKSRR